MLLKDIDDKLVQGICRYLLAPEPISSPSLRKQIRDVISKELVVSFPFAPRDFDQPTSEELKDASRQTTKRTLALFRTGSTALGYLVGAPFKLNITSVIEDDRGLPEQFVYTATLEWDSPAPHLRRLHPKVWDYGKHGRTAILTFEKGGQRTATKVFEDSDDDEYHVGDDIDPHGNPVQRSGGDGAGPSATQAPKAPEPEFEYCLSGFEYRIPALALTKQFIKLEMLQFPPILARLGINLIYRTLRWLGLQAAATSYGHPKPRRAAATSESRPLGLRSPKGKGRADDDDIDSEGSGETVFPDDWAHKALRGDKASPVAGLIGRGESIVESVKPRILERCETLRESLEDFSDSTFGAPIALVANVGLQFCGFKPVVSSARELELAVKLSTARTEQERAETYGRSQNTPFTRSTATATKTTVTTGTYKSRSPSSLSKGVRFVEVHSATIDEEPNEEKDSDGERNSDGGAGLGIGLPGIYQPSPMGSLTTSVFSSSSPSHPSARSLFPTDSNGVDASATPNEDSAPVLRHPASLQSLNGVRLPKAEASEAAEALPADTANSLALDVSVRPLTPRPPLSPEHHRRTSSRDSNKPFISEEDADSSARSPPQTPTEKSSDDDFRDAVSVVPANPLSPKLEPLTPISPIPELDANDRPSSPPLVGLDSRPLRFRRHSGSSSSASSHSPATPADRQLSPISGPNKILPQSSPMMRTSPGVHSGSGSSHGQQLSWQQQQTWMQPVGPAHGNYAQPFLHGTPRPYSAYMPGPYAHHPVTVGPPGYGQQQFSSSPTTPRMSPVTQTQYGGSPRGGSPTSARSTGSSPSLRGGSQRGSPQNYSPPNQQRLGNHPGAAASPTHGTDGTSGNSAAGAMGPPAQQARSKRSKSRKKRGGAGATPGTAGGVSSGISGAE